ncbi:metal-dependent hydrolase [Halopiger djelfimassiliensis]|uniref:metal-dependent hydrolase n=1 Tax=Halopiger djelfimassiliensis TaxID=1293047 RepID=UPI0006778B5D|nr:metal-dependent hydrolase [Halopiger djelfimassiliensis]
MWPWEHAVVGYLVYSLCCRLVYRESPTGLEALVVGIASVLPDVVDKPLAWEFGVFDGGYALAHSVFVAVPLTAAVGVVARSRGRPRAGIAFGIGYLLHPPADVLYNYVSEGQAYPELMLWPVATVDAAAASPGFADEFARLFGRYQRQVLAGELSAYMRVQLALAVGTVLLWLVDGAPVLRECLRGSKRLLAAIAGRDGSDPPTGNQR